MKCKRAQEITRIGIQSSFRYAKKCKKEGAISYNLVYKQSVLKADIEGTLFE